MSTSLWGVQGQSEPQQLRSALTDACGRRELAVCRETLPKKLGSAAARTSMPLAALGLVGALARGAVVVAAVTASSACLCRREERLWRQVLWLRGGCRHLCGAGVKLSGQDKGTGSSEHFHIAQPVPPATGCGQPPGGSCLERALFTWNSVI